MSTRLRRALQPLFFLLLCLAPAARAQDPVRPWLRWRTITTATHQLHFPPELEQFARDAAQRVERIDSAIAAIVGSSPRKPIQVVVDDPLTSPNGYALPLLDKPVTVWWATPADPRSDVGNFTTWGELLSIHELTHLAHLNRPSRNAFQRKLWAVLPANLGPIARRSPRWVYEGYATYVEGRISGTGRPYNAWRPALLRQWAIEGRLPTYGQLSGSSDFHGGNFAYMNGSAFLEWLVTREGDSSLVHVWRRLSARRVRGFDAAFLGVFGDAPATLYGRHAAELTRDAMAAKAELERAGLVEGELVQRLTWYTGDPAVSPNGQRVAIVLRQRDRPSRVVVWKTAAQPEDTAATRRRAEALARDPEDVPDRRFYPAPKQAEKTLRSKNGRSYQMPRWFADNRRLLVTRWNARDDGTLSPALYVWDTQTGDVRQVTRPVGVLGGDPHPDGTKALAMQCHWGHCDVVRVDLARGVMTTLLEGNARTTYYRPRWSPDGSRILASIAENGRWRVVVADSIGRVMRRIDPDDGANRYDAEWLSDDSVVVTSERGGIPNLEIIRLTDGAARALTRVTGAAVGADVNRSDGSVWFLSLHARGLDVRRLPREAAAADSVVRIAEARFGWAGMRGARPLELPPSEIAPARVYGGGPRHARWSPGLYGSADGGGGMLSIYSGDIVGRLPLVLTGAFGERGTWQGAALRGAWRYPRPAIEFGVYGARHEPSKGRDGLPAAAGLDGRLAQGVIALRSHERGEGWQRQERIGVGAGPLRLTGMPSFTRMTAFAEEELSLQQMRGAAGLTEKLQLHVAYGRSRGDFNRILASFEIASAGSDAIPFQIGATAGRIAGTSDPFELFSTSGGTSPVMDSSLMRQRHAMPMLPTGVAGGRAFLAWRAAAPFYPWTVFYEAASAAPELDRIGTWHRAIGVEHSVAFGPVPLAFLPRLQARGGAAYSFDAPFRKKVRVFLEMKVEP